VRTRLEPILEDFRPANIASTLAIGIISGVILVTLTISIAALVFRGDLAIGLPIGVGITLFGTLMIGIVGVFGSGLDGVIAGVQDNTAAVIGAAAASIAAGVTAEQAIPTVIAFIFATAALTALALGGLGFFRLGALVRYIPYPVIGGFQVATGVLILEGAGSILFDSPDASAVLSFTAVARWLPGVALGLVVLLLARNRRGRVVLPWLIVSTIAIVHTALAIGGISRTTAASRNWLLSGFEGQALWQPDVLRTLGDADWGAVVGQGGAIATVIALATISLMIKVGALEQATGQDIDVDRELRVAGLSIAAGAPGGGMPGYMHFSQTLLLRRLAGPRRGPALVAVLMTGAVLLAGDTVLKFVPTALVGSLLVYLGLTFLVEWLWDMRNRLERTDYLLVVGAGGAVVVLGFLPAIALGTLTAIVLFVVRYSRVEAVHHSYTLKVFRSSIERSPDQAAALETIGVGAAVLEVHGFLFFGTAHRVFGDHRLDNADGELRYAVFDLARVTGIDSSASMALAKLVRRGLAEGFEVVLAGLPAAADDLTAQLTTVEGTIREFATLDAAAEWCEERLLAEQPGSERDTVGLERMLSEILGSGRNAQSVVGHFAQIDLEAGDIIIAPGTESPGLFFLESGNLTAQLETIGGEMVRLRTMQPGTLVGEISLYLSGPTTAEVFADGPASVFHLSPAALKEVESTDPAAAAAIHRLAARTLAGRVLHAERALRTFQE
jgi:SulP family sulfate permease